MDFLKQWTLCVCLTLIISTIFSLLAPKGKMNSFFKVLVSLFVFVSFLIPISQYDFSDIDLPEFMIQNEYENRENESVQTMVNNKIVDMLKTNNIKGSIVNSKVSIKDQQITIEAVTVAIPDEYNIDDVKSLIYDNFSINADVRYNGD